MPKVQGPQTFKLKRLWLLTAVAVWLGSVGAATAQSVYSFGDSLSDTGNVKAVTFGEQGGAPYYQGRFSNGPVWVDVVSQAFAGGLQRTNPALLGPFSKTEAGYNFAHAGSVANYVNLNAEQALGFKPPSGSLRVADPFVLIGQAKHFRDQKKLFGGRVFQAGPDDVATISAGGNDYINAKASVATTVPSVIEAMRIIRQRDVTRFLVLDLPPLGDIPAKYGGSQQALLNAKSAQHNAVLNASVKTFSAQTGSRVVVVPLSALFNAVTADIDRNGGRRFGFTIGRPGAGTTGNCLEDGLAGARCPRKYVFYDGMHPTTAMHNLIGRTAVARLMAASASASGTQSRIIALDQSRLPLNQLVAVRLNAAEAGAAMPGIYTNGARGMLADNGIGFIPMGQADRGFSAFRYVSGDAPDIEDTDVAGLTQSGLGRGEYLSGFGADAQLTDTLFVGAATITALRDDPSPWANRTNKSHASAVYALWSEAGNRMGLKLEQGRAKQDLSRYTGLDEAPVALADVASDYLTVRFDAARDRQVDAFKIGLRSAISVTQLNQAGYNERADLDFLEVSMPARSNMGAAAYIGMSASRDMKLDQKWRASMRLEGGFLGASSSRVGFNSLLDTPLMHRSDQTLQFFNEDEKQATTGVLMGVGLGLASTEGFSLDARVDSLLDNQRAGAAGFLRAVHSF